MRLSPRLQLIADKVIPNKKMADIGTDHAYLPSYLLKNNILETIIASDINKGPLEKAKQTVDRYRLEDKISLRLGPGLEPISLGEVEQIAISGMGGEVIINILKNDLEKVKELDQFILQPQSNSDKLRKFLQEEGFCIVSENIAIEPTEQKNRYYEVLVVKQGKMPELDQNELLFGYRPALAKNKNYMDYLYYLILLYQKRIDNMRNSTNEKTKEKYQTFKERLHYLEELYESIKSSSED